MNKELTIIRSPFHILSEYDSDSIKIWSTRYLFGITKLKLHLYLTPCHVLIHYSEVDFL